MKPHDNPLLDLPIMMLAVLSDKANSVTVNVKTTDALTDVLAMADNAFDFNEKAVRDPEGTYDRVWQRWQAYCEKERAKGRAVMPSLAMLGDDEKPIDARVASFWLNEIGIQAGISADVAKVKHLLDIRRAQAAFYAVLVKAAISKAKDPAADVAKLIKDETKTILGRLKKANKANAELAEFVKVKHKSSLSKLYSLPTEGARRVPNTDQG